MGNPLYWYLACIVFGVLSAALYSWMSPRNKGWLSLMLRSGITFTLIAAVIVKLLRMFV